MRSITVGQSRCNVPGEKSPPPAPPRLLSGAEFPPLHGLTEATTNFGLAAALDWAADWAEASMMRQAKSLAIIFQEQASQKPLSNGVNAGACKWELSSQGHRCGA